MQARIDPQYEIYISTEGLVLIGCPLSHPPTANIGKGLHLVAHLQSPLPESGEAVRFNGPCAGPQPSA